MQVDGLQIMTAKSQIQIHNSFFLKETHRLSETIDFLATLTSIITARLADTPLKVIPTRHLSRSSYGTLQTHLRATYPSENFLTSFEAYQDLNDKSASRTLREKFGRMLLCVKGMSAERVGAVLDIWETPRSLWHALNAAKAEVGEDISVAGASPNKGKKARGVEMFFTDRVKGDGRRKIGDALSREVRLPAASVGKQLTCSCIAHSWTSDAVLFWDLVKRHMHIHNRSEIRHDSDLHPTSPV